MSLQVSHVLRLWQLPDVLQNESWLHIQFLADLLQGLLHNQVLVLYLPVATDYRCKGFVHPQPHICFICFNPVVPDPGGLPVVVADDSFHLTIRPVVILEEPCKSSSSS